MDLRLSTSALIFALYWIFVFSASVRPPKLIKKKFIPKKANCDTNHLCDNKTGYPNKAIQKLLIKNKKRFEYLSGSVIEPIANINVEDYRAPDQEDNMCRTRRISKIPTTAYDFKKRLKYIVNVDNVFQQIVTYETCREADKPCFGSEKIPNDFVTFCKQAYTMVRLLSISHNGKLEYAYFPVPSNCVCSYKRLNSYDY